MFKEKMYKRALELYAGSHVVNFVEKLEGKVGLGAYNVPLTFYFQDLHGFQLDSSEVDLERWTQFLQTYLDDMCEIVLKHHGTLDRLVGETIVAFWGAPTAQKNHAELAVNAALFALKHMQQIKTEFSDDVFAKFSTGIGLNTGNAIVGNFGSKYRYTYTAIGDNVKLAAELQASTPTYNVPCLMTEFTYEAIKDKILARELDQIHGTGLNHPLKIYELISARSEAKEEHYHLVEIFQAGVDLFRERRWADASDAFLDALKIQKNDGPCQLYLKRCNHYRDNPPPANWDGIINVNPRT